MVEEMLSYRMDKKNDLANPNWYRGIPGLGDVTIDPSLISTSSSCFEIKSTGIKDSMRKVITGKITREKGSEVRILSWKIE